eukprot:g16930.t1
MDERLRAAHVQFVKHCKLHKIRNKGRVFSLKHMHCAGSKNYPSLAQKHCNAAEAVVLAKWLMGVTLAVACQEPNNEHAKLRAAVFVNFVAMRKHAICFIQRTSFDWHGDLWKDEELNGVLHDMPGPVGQADSPTSHKSSKGFLEENAVQAGEGTGTPLHELMKLGRTDAAEQRWDSWGTGFFTFPEKDRRPRECEHHQQSKPVSPRAATRLQSPRLVAPGDEAR